MLEICIIRIQNAKQLRWREYLFLWGFVPITPTVTASQVKCSRLIHPTKTKYIKQYGMVLDRAIRQHPLLRPLSPTPPTRFPSIQLVFLTLTPTTTIHHITKGALVTWPPYLPLHFRSTWGHITMLVDAPKVWSLRSQWKRWTRNLMVRTNVLVIRAHPSHFVPQQLVPCLLAPLPLVTLKLHISTKFHARPLTTKDPRLPNSAFVIP